MRTEPANCGGGSVIMNKSRQDVEAAFAIAQLSEQEPPHVTDVRTSTLEADNGLTNGCGSAMSRTAPRLSHVRTAVMPYTSSRVEKAAVKRRFDWLDDRHASVNKHARLEEVQRAIESERNTFITARRHLHLPRTDSTDDNKLVGRFIRTCGSGGGGGDMERVRVSDDIARPTLLSSVPSLCTTSTSSRSRSREMVFEDARRPVLTAAVTDGSHLAAPVSQHRRFEHNDMLFHSDTRSTPTSRRYVLPEDHRGVAVLPMRCEEKRLKEGRLTSSDDVDERRQRTSSLASVYYNLGQSAAAAAAASQLVFVKPPRSNSSASVLPAQLTTSCQPHLPRRRVDSGTLRKVRQGQFGVLSTLRAYCSQLRRHSEPTSSADVLKQSVDDDVEVAMDLSMRKAGCEVSSAAGWYRSSRSCGCSPCVRLDDVPQHWQRAGQLAAVDGRQELTSCLSLPCSPYASRYDDLHLSAPSQRHRDDDDDDKRTQSTVVTEVSPEVVPDSRLPLKKRWLYHHHQQQQQQQQQPALSVISEADRDEHIIAESSDNCRHG